jgi:hypothetical protein
MFHYSMIHGTSPSNTHPFRTRIIRLRIFLLVLIMGGLWLMSGPPTNLRGTWENDQRYIIFTSLVAGEVQIESRDCTGYPFHQKGNATLDVVPIQGRLYFPQSDEYQPYQVLGLGHWLIIDDPGPIPPGSYTYVGVETFAHIGICGLQP